MSTILLRTFVFVYQSHVPTREIFNWQWFDNLVLNWRSSLTFFSISLICPNIARILFTISYFSTTNILYTHTKHYNFTLATNWIVTRNPNHNYVCRLTVLTIICAHCFRRVFGCSLFSSNKYTANRNVHDLSRLNGLQFRGYFHSIGTSSLYSQVKDFNLVFDE